jgi:hypothetical protein
MAETMKRPFLSRVPRDPQFVLASDSGQPLPPCENQDKTATDVLDLIRQ